MTIEKINWIEFLRGTLQTIPFPLAPIPTGTTTILAVAEHGAMKLIKGWAVTRVHNTTQPIIAIEDDGGTDLATVTCSATAHASVAFTLTSNIFISSQEALVANVTTAGGAGALVDLFLIFEIFDE